MPYESIRFRAANYPWEAHNVTLNKTMGWSGINVERLNRTCSDSQLCMPFFSRVFCAFWPRSSTPFWNFTYLVFQSPFAWNLRGQSLWQKSFQSSTWLSHQGPPPKTVAFRIHFVVEDFGCLCHGVHQTQPSPYWGCRSAEHFPRSDLSRTVWIDFSPKQKIYRSRIKDNIKDIKGSLSHDLQWISLGF